jgi:hypothetical protein
VPRVDDIEAPVGEHDAVPLASARRDLDEHLVERADAAAPAAWLEELGVDALEGDGDDAEDLDLEPRGGVGEPVAPAQSIPLAIAAASPASIMSPAPVTS